MSLPIPPEIHEFLAAGKIVCPQCRRPLTIADFVDFHEDDDGDHARFRCRICYPTTLPN